MYWFCINLRFRSGKFILLLFLKQVTYAFAYFYLKAQCQDLEAKMRKFFRFCLQVALKGRTIYVHILFGKVIIYPLYGHHNCFTTV